MTADAELSPSWSSCGGLGVSRGGSSGLPSWPGFRLAECLGVTFVTGVCAPHSARLPFPSCVGHSTSCPHRVSVPLLKMVDQMLANGCFDAFTTDTE